MKLYWYDPSQMEWIGPEPPFDMRDRRYGRYPSASLLCKVRNARSMRDIALGYKRESQARMRRPR
jgi:hypothetical protein